ncbi:hypothetical protein ES319_D02G269100v1 [Gossypium barbadense]|uniref:TF-B3 domain-containing protein n=1 Tax=Gossypium barbadense TaxID=3634 RepID=A0A5J5SHV0_GOSBA|nr:hypothetical protein ES319_D02G269100v1 [Gossypium barbadense]PPD77174.1 hypothetical protein GOBAR_DD25893 [Gossypium barbadense]
MPEIFEVVLDQIKKEKLRFHHDGGALPRGSNDLPVRDENGRSWKFNCKSEGGNYFSLSGAEWRSFAKSKVNAMVTLYREEDEHVYTIRVGKF